MVSVSAAQVRDLTVQIAVRRGRNPAVVSVLDGVDLDVVPGRVTALVGESGCGKSLVAAALSGLMPPGSRVRGRVSIGGTEMRYDDEPGWRGLRGRHIGLVPQSAATSFTPVRTVGSQLAEVCGRLSADRTPEQLCAAVALPADVVSRYPHELSGGMAQRVAIAAALAGRPGLLLADEPTSALDPDNAGLVWRLLGDAAAAGAGVLVITHDMQSLQRAGVCDDVALMSRGAVLGQMPLAEATRSADPYTRAMLGTVPV
ncbi:MAG: ATP-binding cassette domain-containing protein [Mycobacterium sp.]|nr:ATP-binding cassette domain-containing protein [Mycobacterium sp.]